MRLFRMEIPDCWAFSTMLTAIGCVELYSHAAAMESSCSSLMSPAGSICCTVKLPFVIVPVLSMTTAFTFSSASIESPPLNSMPSSGCSSDAGEECERHADNECARAAYNEERDRCRDPFAPAACNDRRDYSCEDCESYDYRCVDFCESGDESVHLRLACSSIFD